MDIYREVVVPVVDEMGCRLLRNEEDGETVILVGIDDARYLINVIINDRLMMVHLSCDLVRFPETRRYAASRLVAEELNRKTYFITFSMRGRDVVVDTSVELFDSTKPQERFFLGLGRLLSAIQGSQAPLAKALRQSRSSRPRAVREAERIVNDLEL